MRLKNYIVYIHVSPSNKKYVGITSVHPEARWKSGDGYIANKHFYNAIVKYGWDNIEHIIYKDKLTKKQACKLEKQLIKKYKSNYSQYGYNKTTGGETGWTKSGSKAKMEYDEYIEKRWKKEFELDLNTGLLMVKKGKKWVRYEITEFDRIEKSLLRTMEEIRMAYLGEKKIKEMGLEPIYDRHYKPPKLNSAQ